MTEIKLIEAAFAAMRNSYSPYSHFKVGAALLCKNGKIYTGCNIENSSYGAANCAERTAFFNAISSGERDFCAIAVVGGRHGEITDYCPPCGICRQVMAEFCNGDFKIILARSSEDYIVKSLDEILPLAFNRNNLQEG